MTYWYNIRTGQVEQEPQISRKEDLMGPYPTADAAQNALRSARERTEAWDEEDRREAEREGREPGTGLFG